MLGEKGSSILQNGRGAMFSNNEGEEDDEEDEGGECGEGKGRASKREKGLDNRSSDSDSGVRGRLGDSGRSDEP